KRIKESISSNMTLEEEKELKKIAKAESLQYNKLKKSRWPLLSNRENLNPRKAAHLAEILDSHSSLATCYAMKE
ncbi:MAG: transposase, partial [Eubacteriales bacterium]|nr:transposase [Eubacteriales bacterium]